MAYSVETKGLTKYFNDFLAVDHVDINVETGSFFGFLGPNGAGKSTTIKMLTGLLAPTEGTITLLGHELAKEPLLVKSKIGVVPEELCLFENLTAREYLTFIGRMYSVQEQIIKRRIEELLSLMSLDENEKTLIIEFSHGMKKKLSLAAALIHDPKLLFLDEPFEGIDAIASRSIRDILKRLTKRGSTIFITSHILDIVEKLCSHVAIIHKGQLVTQKTMSEFSNGTSLEKVFIEAVGQPEHSEGALSWIEEKTDVAPA